MIDLPKGGQVDAMSETIIRRYYYDVSDPAEEVVYGNLHETLVSVIKIQEDFN